ncbi:MAG: DUF4387 domain-containing protein [Candidatus Verstraetearchaeota archaeon]|jgi:predicted transcriptional regulator|nr:DUF4387 domain-containing protein [Candidatus Verstraetearchaeota archaeon]
MKLKDLATVIRSKNASPFVLTIDIFFDDDEKYNLVKKSGVINAETISKLYKVPKEKILGIFFVDSVKAIKISFIKPIATDEIEYSDVYGAQQSIPLFDLEVG